MKKIPGPILKNPDFCYSPLFWSLCYCGSVRPRWAVRPRTYGNVGQLNPAGQLGPVGQLGPIP